MRPVIARSRDRTSACTAVMTPGFQVRDGLATTRAPRGSSASLAYLEMTWHVRIWSLHD